jgi:hypothetical protein
MSTPLTKPAAALAGVSSSASAAAVAVVALSRVLRLIRPEPDAWVGYMVAPSSSPAARDSWRPTGGWSWGRCSMVWCR